MLTTPDSLQTDEALHADRYPGWRQEVAARSALRLGFYRPGRYASRVRGPLLVMVCDQDQSALAEPSVKAVRRAPRGELVRLPGGHYQPFLDQHEPAVAAQLEFLHRHLGTPSTTDAPTTTSTSTTDAGNPGRSRSSGSPGRSGGFGTSGSSGSSGGSGSPSSSGSVGAPAGSGGRA
jgi:uncharacterized membrane protein YgcG